MREGACPANWLLQITSFHLLTSLISYYHHHHHYFIHKFPHKSPCLVSVWESLLQLCGCFPIEEELFSDSSRRNGRPPRRARLQRTRPHPHPHTHTTYRWAHPPTHSKTARQSKNNKTHNSPFFNSGQHNNHDSLCALHGILYGSVLYMVQ